MPNDAEKADAAARRRPKAAAERAAANPGGKGTFVEPMLLCALAIRPAHGYELRRAIEDLTEGLITVDLPGLYRQLRRFEREGLAWSCWGASEAGPQRRVYTLTREGHALLADWDQFLNRQKRVCQLATTAIEAVLDVWAADAERFPKATIEGEVTPAEHDAE